MKNYEYDVFLSFTGADREMKNSICEHFEALGLHCYDSDKYCKGDFREDYCEALDKSKVYLMILTDSLRNDPTVSGVGSLTEVRKECSLACELESKNELNIVILCMSEFFAFKNTYHDYHDKLGWFFYTHTRGFSQVFGSVNEDGSLSLGTLDELSSRCRSFVDNRDLGTPVFSQSPRIEIATNKLPERAVFYGRENEIKATVDAFLSGKRIAVLSGIGGMGKTTLATEIARKTEEMSYLQCPQIVHIQELFGTEGGLHPIVSSVSYEKSVYDSIISLSERDKYERKLTALTSLPETVLLVIDNFNTVTDDVLASILHKFKCRVLITTRADIHETPQIFVQRVASLENDKAYEAFTELCGSSVSRATFDELYTLVGGHTITLCIIAKMLSVHQMSLEELLSQIDDLETFDAKVSFEHNGFGDPDTVTGHLKKLFNMSDFSDACKRILRSMSILASGTIEVSTLMAVLGLKNRNEIIELTASGWLELQKKETDYLYLHPILARLMAKLLVPTQENIPEMIAYLAAKADGSVDGLTYSDASRLADSLYYACFVLATSTKKLTPELWEGFTTINHIIGDLKSTSRKLEALTAQMSIGEERALVISYGDMVTLERYPTRLDIIEKYLKNLSENSHNYKWVLRSLSVAYKHISCVKESAPALASALKDAISVAIDHEDDFALSELLILYSNINENKKSNQSVISSLKKYVKKRKKSGVNTGELLYLEQMLSLQSLTNGSSKKMSSFLSKCNNAIINDKVLPFILLFLRHPVTLIKMTAIIYRAYKLDENDPLSLYWQLLITESERQIIDREIDATSYINMMVELHQHRIDTQTTLASIGNAIVAAIAGLSAYPKEMIKKCTMQLTEGFDSENVTVGSLSNLHVALLINQQYGHKEAIGQSLDFVNAVKRSRPEGHSDITDAMILRADILASQGLHADAMKLYQEVIKILKAHAPDSAMISQTSRKILKLDADSETTFLTYEGKYREVLADATADLADTASAFFDVYTSYTNIFIQRIKRWDDLNAYMKKHNYTFTVVNPFDELTYTVKHLLTLNTKMIQMDQFAQRSLIILYHNIFIKLQDLKQTFLNDLLFEGIRPFLSSNIKTNRVFANILNLKCESSVLYCSGKTEESIKQPLEVIRLCVKHHSYLGQAASALYSMIYRIPETPQYRYLVTGKQELEWLDASIQHHYESRYENTVEGQSFKDDKEYLKLVRKKLNYIAGHYYNENFYITPKEFRKMKTVEDFYFLAMKNILGILNTLP